jgi:hypothetical protein
MHHAFMFNASEGPGQDRDIKEIGSEGELGRIAAYEIYLGYQVGWGFDACDPECGCIQVHPDDPFRSFGVPPGQSSITAADLQYLSLIEIGKLVQNFLFGSFWIFLNCHSLITFLMIDL